MSFMSNECKNERGVRRRLEETLRLLRKLNQQAKFAATRWETSRPEESRLNALRSEGYERAIGGLQNFIDTRLP